MQMHPLYKFDFATSPGPWYSIHLSFSSRWSWRAGEDDLPVMFRHDRETDRAGELQAQPFLRDFQVVRPYAIFLKVAVALRAQGKS